MSHGESHQCAVCFNSHRVTKAGNPRRHGFKVHGRTRGQYYVAWQTGPCNGVSFPHFGLSDEGTRWALAQMQAVLGQTEQRLAEIEEKPALLWNPGKRLANDGVQARYLKAGDEARKLEEADFDEEHKHRAYWYTRPYCKVGVPSYEELHNAEVTRLGNEIKSLKGTIAQYQTAIATWKPEGGTDGTWVLSD